MSAPNLPLQHLSPHPLPCSPIKASHLVNLSVFKDPIQGLGANESIGEGGKGGGGGGGSPSDCSGQCQGQTCPGSI